ncbi:MAG: nitroreductase family deazaflavin-dependent oxidoreductase [Anaerolineales bacterium]|nr:nitroreductase family deazaflavin-dependent oxidoreductase [Anaerolineales bacterium]
MGGQNILLLHHVGARSGTLYITPLGYVEDSEGGRKAYVIVAAAAGQPKHPGWYYNLSKRPHTLIEIKGQKIKVKAEVASKEKRDKLWQEISAKFPQFTIYEKKVARVIPIILLYPQVGDSP